MCFLLSEHKNLTFTNQDISKVGRWYQAGKSLMIEQIQKMKQEFNLQSEEKEDSVKKIVLSNLNEAWSSLKDLKEGKIHGHDQLSYRDKQLLNAHITKLYSMSESIYSDIHRL
jgi:hypothetical protein